MITIILALVSWSIILMVSILIIKEKKSRQKIIGKVIPISDRQKIIGKVIPISDRQIIYKSCFYPTKENTFRKCFGWSIEGDEGHPECIGCPYKVKGMKIDMLEFRLIARAEICGFCGREGMREQIIRIAPEGGKYYGQSYIKYDSSSD